MAEYGATHALPTKLNPVWKTLGESWRCEENSSPVRPTNVSERIEAWNEATGARAPVHRKVDPRAVAACVAGEKEDRVDDAFDRNGARNFNISKIFRLRRMFLCIFL